MNTNDPVLDRIESAERMLRQARAEYQRGNAEDASTFLDASRNNIERASDAMKPKPKPKKNAGVRTVAIVDGSGTTPQKIADVVTHRREVARAR